jgi:hypothetical protein
MEKRLVELKVKNEWKKVEMKELKKGDVFRIFEDDKSQVMLDDGRNEFLCSCDAFIGPYGPQNSQVWTVEIEL